MRELLEEAKKEEDKIIKLQAGWRAHQVRKSMKEAKEDIKNKPRPSARTS
jgi:hypothetical protein